MSKYKLTEKDEKQIKKLIKKAYKFLNGKINPRYKSHKLVIHNELRVRMVDEDETFYAATADAGRVDVYLNDIVEFFGSYRSAVASNYMYTGYIICLVAHELSHVDQYMPIFMTTEERLAIEVSNELNTLSYIDKYRQELENEFGEFSTVEYQNRSQYLSPEYLSIYKKLLEAVKEDNELYDVFSYKKINSPITILWRQLAGLTMMDMYTFLHDHPDIDRVAVIIRDMIINDCESVLMLYTEDLRNPETYQTYQKADFALSWLTNTIVQGLHWDADVYIPEDDPKTFVISLNSTKAMKNASAIETFEAESRYWDNVCAIDENGNADKNFMEKYHLNTFIESKEKMYKDLLDNLDKKK